MFRQWAAQQRQRFELVAGEPVAMSAGPIGHARLKARVWQTLDRAIREAGLSCEALPDGVSVEVGEDTDYAPDAVVNCGPEADTELEAAPNPVIVVEVLSQATRAADTGAKLADYFLAPSIQHYLIVENRRTLVIHHRRRGDRVETRLVFSGVIKLDPPGFSITVEDFYRAG